MKITKYPQSCLLIEVGGQRIIIDPGNFVAEKYIAEKFLPLNAILITHQHSDHMDAKLIEQLAEASQAEVIANESSAKLLGNLVTRVIVDGEALSIGGVKITARELPHVLLPNGQPGPQNTGYIINDTFFHPGDGLDINLQIETVAAPIAGPDISPKDVVDFVKKLGAKNVIPIHYEYWIADPNMFVNLFGENVKVYPLVNGEFVELK